MHTKRSAGSLFLQSLALTLLLMLPMVAAVAFFARQRQQQLQLLQVTVGQDGIPVTAGAQSTHRMLLAVQGEEPAFLLLRVDAPARTITLCALPPRLLVQAPAGQTTLADCYMAAGPARAAQLLGQTVGVAPERYFAATAATYAGLLPEAATIEWQGGTLDPAGAVTLLAAEPDKRAAVWAAFLCADTANLTGLAAAARESDARTLTDLRAQDLHDLEQTLAYLAGCGELTVRWETLDTAPTADIERLTEDGRRQAAALLG